MAKSGARESRHLGTSVALAITLIALWALTHEYRGLVYDGQIYAVQALAKLRPSLDSDLFLQNITQDQFTIFTRIYAGCISLVGLEPAALLLTALFGIGFLCATWHVAASLFDRDIAWLTVFLVVITGGNYGASGVFHFLEPFLTARSAAEALIVTALGVYLRGFERIGLALAAGALLVHPLMALPGFLLLLCMRLPSRCRSIILVVGVVGCWGAALASTRMPAVGRALPVMDLPWLKIVRERSQFLFLQLWTAQDWELNARPFVCLMLTSLTLRDPRVQRLSQCAVVVGAAGLAIAWIASAIGPVALLVQGQAWRWVWITDLVSILLLLPTARHLWSTEQWGPSCALLLVAGWSLPAAIGFVYASMALALWVLRQHPRLQSTHGPRWAMAAIIVSIVACALLDTRETLTALAGTPTYAHSAVSSARAIVGARIWCVVIAALAWVSIRKSRSIALPIGVSCALMTVSSLLFYDSFIDTKSYASAAQLDAFADWRAAIPPADTVFVTNGHDSGSFVWFTLERNNYLSPGQSAGVVFSRATALEVRRRSDVLLPLVDPNWKMMTALQHGVGGKPGGATLGHRSLTAQSLVAVCHDPALGFVVSPDAVGFDPIRHERAGAYQGWNLYDCHHVRTLTPIA